VEEAEEVAVATVDVVIMIAVDAVTAEASTTLEQARLQRLDYVLP
jgi:hypothetical protein